MKFLFHPMHTVIKFRGDIGSEIIPKGSEIWSGDKSKGEKKKSSCVSARTRLLSMIFRNESVLGKVGCCITGLCIFVFMCLNMVRNMFLLSFVFSSIVTHPSAVFCPLVSIPFSSPGTGGTPFGLSYFPH